MTEFVEMAKFIKWYYPSLKIKKHKRAVMTTMLFLYMIDNNLK